MEIISKRRMFMDMDLFVSNLYQPCHDLSCGILSSMRHYLSCQAIPVGTGALNGELSVCGVF